VPRLRANGVSLHYEEHGTGDSILCLHGTGSSSVLWTDAAIELAKRGRAILYDRRGFSRSERPEPFVTDVHQQADDAAAVIDVLEAAPTIAIGRSQGGEIAVDLALRYPDRVRALALLEGGGLALGEGLRRWLAGVDEQVFAAGERDVDSVGETLLRAIVGDDGWDGLPGPVKEIFSANGEAIVAEERGGLLDVTADELGSIEQPTLIVAGTDSPPEFAEAIELVAAAIPSSRVAWVEGGHVINPAHPAVLAFLDEVLGE
jgi:pimeloyl-ACP methyl ester carboxylesterase